MPGVRAGVVSTSPLFAEEGRTPSNGSLVAPGVNSHIHQHFFCVRMDMAVDCDAGGEALQVTEVSAGPPGRDTWVLNSDEQST